MSKASLLNLILLMIVISLAGLIYVSEPTDNRLQRLTQTDSNLITKIEIQHNGHTTKIIKQNDHWYITSPLSIAANNFRINTILKLLNAPVHKKYQRDALDIKTAGFSESSTRVTLNDLSFTFGINNPATGLRYILFDDHIYTIEDVFLPLISSHFSTLVSLNLLPDNSKLEKLILINQTISKDNNGHWSSNIDISADVINATIDHWLNDQAFGIHEYLKRKNLGSVFIYLRENQQGKTPQTKIIRFDITDTDPWLVLARPDIGLEYHLDIEAYDKLITPDTEPAKSLEKSTRKIDQDA